MQACPSDGCHGERAPLAIPRSQFSVDPLQGARMPKLSESDSSLPSERIAVKESSTESSVNQAAGGLFQFELCAQLDGFCFVFEFAG